MLQITPRREGRFVATSIYGPIEEVICHLADIMRRHATEPLEVRPAITALRMAPSNHLRCVVYDLADDVRQITLPLAYGDADYEYIEGWMARDHVIEQHV